jgi:hypothetical protein
MNTINRQGDGYWYVQEGGRGPGRESEDTVLHHNSTHKYTCIIMYLCLIVHAHIVAVIPIAT